MYIYFSEVRANRVVTSSQSKFDFFNTKLLVLKEGASTILAIVLQ